MKTLLAWIGLTDIRASQNSSDDGLGPIAQAVASRKFDRISLVSNLDAELNSAYREWLVAQTKALIDVYTVELSSPTEYGEIYKAVVEVVGGIERQIESNSSLTFHLSPGTPAMAAVWIIVAKTRFPAELIESSKHKGVRTVSVPFEISAELMPDLIRQADEQLQKAADFSSAARFGDIVFQSAEMREAVEQAQTIAPHNIPVLIEGESGTGKELFARAIHLAGQRKEKPFVAVNCGAIPSELVEAELFGHTKGAFTGADKKRAGLFREADGGTIFLDEIGELPLRAQVRLLRVLQENEITPVGSSQPEKIDVRVVSATNRTLSEEVAQGNFREDLFYRLAVFLLRLPPLRERQNDVSLLVGHFLDKLNNENTGKFWREAKTLSPEATDILSKYRWNGNVRELQNAILRISIMTKSRVITAADVQKNLLAAKNGKSPDVLNLPIGNGFSLPSLLATTAKHYLDRALTEAQQNKTKAAKLLGFANYQTFNNWLEKYR